MKVGHQKKINACYTTLRKAAPKVWLPYIVQATEYNELNVKELEETLEKLYFIKSLFLGGCPKSNK